MDVRLATQSSSSNDVDVSEFLSLTNQSPLMHTLHPLLPNGTAVEADLGIMANDLEAMTAVDVSKPGGYDLLNPSCVTEAYPASTGQNVGFVSIHSGLGSAAEINTSFVSSVGLPSDCPQYYDSMKLASTQDSGTSFGQLNMSAVTTLASQVPASSTQPTPDFLTVPSNFVMPSAETLSNFRPAGVVDVSTPPKKPLSPYMRFSKGVRIFLIYSLIISPVSVYKNITALLITIVQRWSRGQGQGSLRPRPLPFCVIRLSRVKIKINVRVRKLRIRFSVES